MTTDADLRRKLSSRLDREWAHLRHRPQVLARVRSWGLTDRPFASLDELLRMAGYRSPPTGESERILGRLVTVAAHEPLAVRIVLQRILAGLLAIVRQEQERDPSVDAFELLVGEAWIAITRYRVDSRPTDIAARLLSDARDRAFTRHRRRRAVEEIATPRESLLDIVDDTQPPAFDELIGELTEARRLGLDDRSMATIREFLHHGSSARAAAARSITARSMRYRRRTALARVRRLVLAA